MVHQAPLSMEFSRQEYWSGQLFPSPGDLPDPEIKPWSPVLPADSLPSEPPKKSNLPIMWAKFLCNERATWQMCVGHTVYVPHIVLGARDQTVTQTSTVTTWRNFSPMRKANDFIIQVIVK